MSRQQDFEACYKSFPAGAAEPSAMQRTATELTLVVQGQASVNGTVMNEGDICLVLPGEFADFVALTDCKVVGIKFPSTPNDKVLS